MCFGRQLKSFWRLKKAEAESARQQICLQDYAIELQHSHCQVIGC